MEEEELRKWWCVPYSVFDLAPGLSFADLVFLFFCAL